MNPITKINERVDIVPIFYASAKDGLVCVPWCMNYRNEQITFKKLGMRHPTEKGKRMIHVFDVADDANDYRLEFDAERLTWTLVSIVEGHYVK